MSQYMPWKRLNLFSIILTRLKQKQLSIDMKELYKERNNLYEKQNDLKGQKWKIEKSLER